jgi:putative exporter of polyketide antibiotics
MDEDKLYDEFKDAFQRIEALEARNSTFERILNWTFTIISIILAIAGFILYLKIYHII